MSEDVGKCGWCQARRNLVGIIPLPESRPGDHNRENPKTEIRLCSSCTREAIEKVYFVRRIGEGETESQNRFTRNVTKSHQKIERDRKASAPDAGE